MLRRLQLTFYSLVHYLIHMYKKMDIMALFFEAQERKLHIREVARLKGMSPMTARRLLNELVEDGLLKKEKGRLFDLFSAKQSDLFLVESRAHFARKLVTSGLVAFLDKALHVPRAMVLFGSCAKAEVLEKSDIDLFVLTDSEKDVNLERYEKKLGRQIQLFVHTPRSFEKLKKKSPELLDNIINGLTIKGHLEAFS